MKPSCQILAQVLKAQGVRHVVVSPGSRNAPLLLALDAQNGLQLHVVIDERSAAFIALGMAQVRREPVALCCTSGTALLNYGPALGEAYYQGIPLVAVSADRPFWWIDQDDSQTMRQPGALSHFVKASYDIPDFCQDNTAMCTYSARVVSDACLTAKSGRPGPVHINVQLDEPLTDLTPITTAPCSVSRYQTELCVPPAVMKQMAEIASTKRILIVAGQNPPSNRINRAIAVLSHIPNVAVWTENIANLHTPDVVDCIDRTLLGLNEDEREALRPDIVISFGGALVSRMAKVFLRETPRCEHWSVGIRRGPLADPFRHLCRQIETTPEIFLPHFAHALCRTKPQSDYGALWQDAAIRGEAKHELKTDQTPWSLMRAISYILPRIPAKYNLQISNGTAIRYTQLFDCRHVHAIYCNRGVSGIDGCTSTAVGASMVSHHPTLFITGDMSFAYDIGALGAQGLSPDLKIIVLNNRGGGIFRFIRSTSHLSNREQYFCVPPALPLQKLCEAYGIKYLYADSSAALKKTLPKLWAGSLSPTLLEIEVDPQVSASTLSDYFKNKL